jgi:hypothetical protein
MDYDNPPEQQRQGSYPIPDEHITADKRYDRYNAEKQLAQAIGSAHEVLATATTVFPFTLFPDTITIDRTKLTVAHRSFFSVAEVMSINVEDVLNVTANVGPFFGSLRITTRFFDPGKPYEVNWLRRADAIKLKRVLQGYILAIQRRIDCSALATKELTRLLDELGQGTPDE